MRLFWLLDQLLQFSLHIPDIRITLSVDKYTEHVFPYVLGHRILVKMKTCHSGKQGHSNHLFPEFHLVPVDIFSWFFYIVSRYHIIFSKFLYWLFFNLPVKKRCDKSGAMVRTILRG